MNRLDIQEIICDYISCLDENELEQFFNKLFPENKIKHIQFDQYERLSKPKRSNSRE